MLIYAVSSCQSWLLSNYSNQNIVVCNSLETRGHAAYIAWFHTRVGAGFVC